MPATGYLCNGSVINKEGNPTDYVVYIRVEGGPPAWGYRTIEQGSPDQDTELTVTDTIEDAKAAADSWAASIGGHIPGYGCPDR
jgi:hypothetical protein